MSAPKAPQPDNTELRVGRLTKAHGLKGAIKVELYTDAPERRFVPGAVFA
ncbi:MAG: ribosome maturation factor RimM, partial [Rhodoglobus sp.]|nr:ribosome maturation factor RimM [Rhodoglobus sp.]